MKSLLIAMIVSLLAMVSCTPKCDVQDKVVVAISDKIVTTFECKKPEAVKATVVEELKKHDMCKDPSAPNAKGAVGDAVCPMIGKALVGLVLNGVMPAAWECTGGATTDQLEKIVTDTCKAYAPI